MRLAGKITEDPEMFEAIWKHLKSDGVPDQAANQITAEMFHHGTDVDTSVEKYTRMYENYKSKGYEEHAAQAMAVEAMEGNSFSVPDGASREDIVAISERLTGIRPDQVIID